MRDVGMTALSWSALFAFRMRVSMSAIGSVNIASPARFRHAGNRALMGEVAQADAAEPELAEHRARPAAPVAARVVAHPVLLLTLLLDDEARLCHLVPPWPFAERQAECLQKGAGVIVGLGAGRDRHVEAAYLLDVVVVDLREDDLFAHAERVVAAAVERAGVEAPEVADARQRDRDQPVEELVHARAAERHLRAHRHALAHLELRDRLPRAAYLCALAGDRRQLLDGRVEQLRVRLRLAHAHVQRDLLEARHLHDGVEAEIVLQLRTDLALVAHLQARRVGVGRCCAHDLSISWPQSACLHTRTRTCLSFTVFRTVPTRVGFLHVGQTIITFETGSGADFSMIPPGTIDGPPMRFAFWIGRGRWCRLTMLTFSTSTRPSFGMEAMTRPSLPRSLPRMTCTMSPWRIFIVWAIYNTSGASETIFMKFFSRSSRATGPKMRVPRGLRCASMITAAFSSNAIEVPSTRPNGLRVRTTTARTTSPFLTAPCGVAVLTLPTMMSPTRA